MRTLIILLCCFTVAACTADREEVNVRLTMAERERVDQLTVAYMDSLRPLLKARCANSFADRVAVATDSIIQRRLEEEARLRARIPENLLDDR